MGAGPILLDKLIELLLYLGEVSRREQRGGEQDREQTKDLFID